MILQVHVDMVNQISIAFEERRVFTFEVFKVDMPNDCKSNALDRPLDGDCIHDLSNRISRVI